ncbi:MAG: GNAT family N-acetyltransferase [Chloroflexi bacterium]|jgi:hypothetical protein|nr:GNAT family N-acetyltransferase [Chloroflexota bacterium]
MLSRPYDPERDREAAHRIWQEVGWLEKEARHLEAFDAMLTSVRAMVADLNGQAECLVVTGPGVLRYLDRDLPLSVVLGVATSHVGRKQGLASQLAARAVALDAASGAQVVALSMFEQGYYNQLGFGTGDYELLVRFDPSRLHTRVKHRAPTRLSADDWEQMHAAHLQRARRHGAVSILAPAVIRAEMVWTKNPVGLGYHDGPDGSLSHGLWISATEIANGPYELQWMVYQTRDQLLELLALIASLGDQVRLFTMTEPAGVQLQSLLRFPFRYRQISEKSAFATGIGASAWWQMRICDVPGCLAQTSVYGEQLPFNLHLIDPIERYLPDDAPWRGVGGNYVVTIGPTSHAEPGTHPKLPTLTASVGAFTRLWLGVRPASGLAVTDRLSGPPDLLERLDNTLRLPSPKTDWPF